jgi:PilZ domain
MNKNRNFHLVLAPRSTQRVNTVSGIVLNYEGNSELTIVRSPDVSTRGMFINTTRSFPEGAILNVRFRLALTDASVHARGEVRYCLPGVGIGLEFVNLEPVTLKLLEKEVECGTTIRKRSRSSARPRRKPKRSRQTISKSRRSSS